MSCKTLKILKSFSVAGVFAVNTMKCFMRHILITVSISNWGF